MKKAILPVLLLLCALLCACGKQTLSEKDIRLNVDGVEVTCDSGAAELLAAFGEEYTYSEAISCVYTGMDKTWQYSDCILYTYPDGENDRLMELYCTQNVTTAKGIAIGASRKDVEAAYGKEYEKAGTTITYALEAPDSLTLPASIYFELENDTVCAIGITSAHRAE